MAMTLQQHQFNIRLSSGLDVIVGAWLIVSPLLLGFADNNPALINSLVAGAVIVLLSSVRTTRAGATIVWPSVISILVGFWMISAPFLLAYQDATAALWNSVIAGGLIVVLAAWSALATPDEYL